MNQNAAPTLQPFLNKFARPGKFAQEIFILDIVDLHTTVLVLVPVFEILKVIAQNRNYVRNVCGLQGRASVESEYSSSSLIRNDPICFAWQQRGQTPKSPTHVAR